MQVVILCGGDGIRLKDQVEYIPKALVPVGKLPIVFEIMKHFFFYGFSNFILCNGERGEMIQEFFEKKDLPEPILKLISQWNIRFLDTGVDTRTGYRIQQAKDLVLEDDKNDSFLLTYSDIISDINLRKLVYFHKYKEKTLTMVGAHPRTPLGILESDDGMVTSYSIEKRFSNAVKGGYFVCHKRLFDYLENKPDCTLEKEPIQKLIKEKEVSYFEHDGFWHHLESYKQVLEINRVDLSQKPSWSIEL